MDQQALALYRKALKEQRDAVHLRLVFASEQTQGISRFEREGDVECGRAWSAHAMSSLPRTQAQDLLALINGALDRIDAGGFGRCLNCGQEMNERRLNAVPWAQYCTTCQELMNAA